MGQHGLPQEDVAEPTGGELHQRQHPTRYFCQGLDAIMFVRKVFCVAAIVSRK